MASLKTYLVAAAMASMAAAETIKITAASNNTFSPDTVKANNGDILEFHFQPQNHSVAAGDYRNPCSPTATGSGFFSGYMPVDSGESDKVFRVTVNGTDPMVFFSTQGDECPKGMVGIVNPNDKENLDSYKKSAAGMARAVAPMSMYGGEVANNDNKDGDDKDSKDKDGKDKKSAGNVLHVPVAALAAAVGAVVYLM